MDTSQDSISLRTDRESISAKHFVSKENYSFTFDSKLPPVLKVQPSEIIEIETWDCYMGKVTLENPTISISDKEVNGATGPIYIEGAEPGDTLSVTILDIRPNEVGVARVFPGEGQLGHLISEPFAQFFKINDGFVKMNNPKQELAVQFPLAPMIGVIGVAPEKDFIYTMPAGKHGGNLDNNENTIGATIHLPVKHRGGLLAIGDMHASMGDGEIGGTGVEVGGKVLISTRVIKGKQKIFPVTENENYWITHGVADLDINLAMQYACEEASKILVDNWGFTIKESFIFLSVVGNLGVAQNVHPSEGTVIAKMRVPKLPACPAPFNLRNY